jgi:hypothetical protein
MFKHGGAGLYIFFSILSSIEISEDAKINHITLQFSTNIFGNIWEKKNIFVSKIIWLKTISWLLEIYHPSKRWMVGRTVCMVHSLTLHLYCPCYCCHSVLWYYVVFLSGSKSEQFFLMVCLYMYCRWRSSCQEGRIRIPLTG